MARGKQAAITEVKISALAAGGDGIAHTDGGRVIFVPGALPGDHVRAKLLPTKAGPLRAKNFRLISAGPTRREPPCKHAQKCGGCPWMVMDYDAQLTSKAQLVRDAMERLGGLDGDLVQEPIMSEEKLGYRTRARLYVMGRDIGFHGRGSKQVVDTPDCLIVTPALQGLIQEIRRILQPFLPISDGLRIEISERPDGLLQLGATGEAASLLTSLAQPGKVQVIASPVAFNDHTAPLLSFQQANQAGNLKMIEMVTEWMQPQRGKRYLDLYCGSGNFTLPLVQAKASAVGIEVADEAISRAKVRCKGHKKATFLHRLADQGLKEQLKAGKSFDAIVINPPRGGAKEVADRLHLSKAKRIAYVSCNPATLARDLATLSEHYEVQSITPVDLMPQTFHVEAVALLSRKEES